MKERKLELLLAQETIATFVNQLAQAIDRDDQGGFPVVLGILTNSSIFLKTELNEFNHVTPYWYEIQQKFSCRIAQKSA